MFSHDIVSSDAFLEMPNSSRELYFQLGMYADDDGFVNPKKVMKICGASDDDLKILVGKRFLLPFDNGVVVIKHWLIHNLIRANRYKETQYIDEKLSLRIKKNRSYTDNARDGLPVAGLLTAQGRVGKGRVVKGNKNTESLPKKEWKYENTLEDMRKGEDKTKKVLAYFWTLKEFKFENSKQVSLRFGRDMKTAKKLVDSGYSGKQIENGFDYVQKKYKDIDWTLETVVKVIAEANK